MDKKIIWIIAAIIILFVIIGGASVGTAYYLAKKAASTPTPSTSISATPCTNCGESPSPSSLTSAEIEERHCLKDPVVNTGNITIADLAYYSEVQSPIIFSGTANVFEGAFMVRLVDCESGQKINEVNGQTSGGEIGMSNPYSVTITYPSSYSGHFATIEAYDLSAMDGKVQDLIQVPVLLK